MIKYIFLFLLGIVLFICWTLKRRTDPFNKDKYFTAFYQAVFSKSRLVQSSPVFRFSFHADVTLVTSILFQTVPLLIVHVDSVGTGFVKLFEAKGIRNYLEK